MKILLFAGLLVLSCTQQRELPHYLLPETEVIGYTYENNIHKADSVKAIAMLLNRECPECCFEEKVYVASCIVTGSKSLGVSWKTYIFNLGQFWGFSDKRVIFDPIKNKENLLATQVAWEHPKKVRFYATKIDGLHFKQVKRNGVKPANFYHHFSFKN